MTPGKPLRKADFLTSIIFILIGLGILLGAYRMPWKVESAGLSQDWYLSPGLFPAVLGVLLIGFSLNVLINAVREGGHRELLPFIARHVGEIDGNRNLHRILIAVLLMTVYIFVGIGKLNYYFASSVFLFASMLVFHRPAGKSLDLPSALKVLVIAVLAPLVIGYLFSEFFQVPMP